MAATLQRNVIHYSDASDEDLLDAVRQGLDSHVTVFVQRYNSYLYRVARGVLGNDADAQDALQEAWVRIISNIDKYSDGSLVAWLTKITLNEAIRIFQNRKRRNSHYEFHGEGMSSGEQSHAPLSYEPDQASEQDELNRILNMKIDSLPLHFRTVLVLRDIQGHTIDETANLLGIQAATVKTRLHRARKHLKLDIGILLRREGLTPYEFGGKRCRAITIQVMSRLYENKTIYKVLPVRRLAAILQTLDQHKVLDRL